MVDLKNQKAVNIIAAGLLLTMTFLLFLSMKGESLTFDELAHITAGYSYLTKQDYRINPEHPPLIKDIPALPLLFLKLNFPDKSEAWLQENTPPAWWTQFELGNQFIYHSGNNPRLIIFWARIAMIVLTLITALSFFKLAKKISNNIIALIALTFFVFSPTILAHGKLVTTDVGASLGVVLVIMFWLNFLYNPSWKNVFFAGIAFGVSMLLKFSLILLIPFSALITILYIILFQKNILQYLFKSLLIGIIGFIFVIWPVYQFHILNYLASQQERDTKADISNNPLVFLKNLTIKMTQNDILRAPAQYFRGVLMASQRTFWGNTTYFLGEISTESWKYYFPTLYLLKEPLAFHILTLLTLIYFILSLKHLFFENILDILKRNFPLLTILLWVIIYWTIAVTGNLNIGIRHILPLIPLTYLLISVGLYRIIRKIAENKERIVLFSFILPLFLWYIVSSLGSFPYYLSYYNELAGGIKNGYKVAVDSNYDWGQDFYRLLSFIEKNKIEKIYLDYFGGEDPSYWLGEKYIKLDPKNIKEKPKGWVAVSVNQLMGGIARPSKNYNQETGYYDWLLSYPLVAKAGYSIFIFYVD